MFDEWFGATSTEVPAIGAVLDEMPNLAGIVRNWSKAEHELQGADSDVAIAQRLKRSIDSVPLSRISLCIPNGNPMHHRWIQMADRLLGKYSNEEVASD